MSNHNRIDEQINTQTGWGIQQNSEYSELLDHWLHKLDESGVRERMWTNWTYKATEEFWVEDTTVLGFNEITFVFLWILGGIVISLVFFLIEKAVYMVRPRKAENGPRAKNAQRLWAEQIMA